MGQTHVIVEISRLVSPSETFGAPFRVQRRGVHCFVPRRELERIGVTVEGRCVVELRRSSFEVGFVRAVILGRQTVCHALFGPDDMEPVLGAITLESVGLTLNPGTGALVSRLHVPLKGLPTGDHASAGPGAGVAFSP